MGRKIVTAYCSQLFTIILNSTVRRETRSQTSESSKLSKSSELSEKTMLNSRPGKIFPSRKLKEAAMLLPISLAAFQTEDLHSRHLSRKKKPGSSNH